MVKWLRRKQYVRPDDGNKSKLGTTWADVEGMIRLHSFPKWAGRLLGCLVVVAMVAFGFGAWNLYRVDNLARAVQSGAISSCLSGNTARATNKMLWDEFLAILVNNPQNRKTRNSLEAAVGKLKITPAMRQGLDDIIVENWTNNPGNVKIVQGFEAYIATHEAPQACTAIFGARGGTASSGLPQTAEMSFTGPSFTSTTVRLQSWNGLCLTAASANQGTRVTEVSCVDAHWWEYVSNGELELQGHPGTALADVGGVPAMRLTPTTEILEDNGKIGPAGYVYGELCEGTSGKCVAGTYLHANGVHHNLTFDKERGDPANYYAFLEKGNSPAVGVPAAV